MTVNKFRFGFSLLGILFLIHLCAFKTGSDSCREIGIQSKTAKENEAKIQSGDLIFQSSNSDQALAIEMATHSRYSHCGLIMKEGDKYFVYEAVQPVQKNSLESWIARGRDGHYVIKRLKNAGDVLDANAVNKLKNELNSFIGKNYDIYFGCSDEKIYCSELVWKSYQRATGIEIGKPEKLSDFDLSSKVVQESLKERYGSNIPLDEQVISPARIFNSDLLVTVISE
jgi:uncharacterized protein YycO